MVTCDNLKIILSEYSKLLTELNIQVWGIREQTECGRRQKSKLASLEEALKFDHLYPSPIVKTNKNHSIYDDWHNWLPCA